MKKITNNTVSYLFSVFNGKKITIDNDSNYSPFMMNRYLAVTDNYKFIELAEFLNRKMGELDKVYHYNYLLRKITKGFYKVDLKSNFFSDCKFYNDMNKRFKPLVSDYGMKFEDVYFLMETMTDKEFDKLDKILDMLDETK